MDSVNIAQYVIFGIAQACGLVSFFVMIALFSEYGGITWDNSANVHGFLALFVVYLQGLAISAYRILPFVDQKILMLIHGSIHFCVLALYAVALSAALGKVTFYSLHGIIGIITFCLFAIQWLLGFGSFLYPKLEEENRAKLKIVHRVFGVFIFSLATVTALMGIGMYMYMLILGNADAFFDSSYVQGSCISAGLLSLCYGALTVFIARSLFFKDD